MYDYFKELKIWKEWKKEEEKKLRELNVDEKIIEDLYDFDWKQFNDNRKFYRWQSPTLDTFFTTAASNNNKYPNNIYELLDEIENEALYHYLSSLDDSTLAIIYLKYQGYTVKEISEILSLSIDQIYYRIQKIKKFINNN